MYPAPNEAAAVLAAMLKRSGQGRARISRATVKKVSRRTALRSSFIVELGDALADAYGWIFVELDSGGFGAVQGKALEAAKPVTGMKYLSADERDAIDRGLIDYRALHAEVVGEEDGPDDDE